MHEGTERLLACLADGQRHSGQTLASDLGVSRAAVWKRIESLRALGIEIDARSGGGYQLRQAFQPLDCDRIRARLRAPEIDLECRFMVDSTNACLARESRQRPAPRALLADTQTAGRGRRGRAWLSPLGAGLYLSLAWRFESGLTGLSALSLVSGLAAAEALAEQGAPRVALKWPNDLLIDDAKLGGCLVELSGAAEGPCQATVGIGINLALSVDTELDQAWTDLAHQGLAVDRSALAAGLINALSEGLSEFERAGFDPLIERWRARDALAGREIRIERAGQPDLVGRAVGVDSQGRLLLEHAHGLEAISSGEVRVRAL